MSNEIDNNFKMGAGLKASFNAASIFDKNQLAQLKEKELQDKLIDTALASGSDTGYIGRVDKQGYQVKQRTELEKEQIKKLRSSEILRLAIIALSRSIESGLNDLAKNIQKTYDLANEILQDIAETQKDMDTIGHSHEAFEEALKQGEPLRDENGQFKSKATQGLSDRAGKRLGKTLPDDPARLTTILIVQMEHEKSKVLPVMAGVNDKRSALYDRLINGTRSNEKTLEQLIEDHERLIRLPDSEEKHRQLKEIEDKTKVTNAEQNRIQVEGEPESKNLKNKIEEAVDSRTEDNNVVVQKLDDSEGLDDLTSSPVSSPPSSPLPRPGR